MSYVTSSMVLQVSLNEKCSDRCVSELTDWNGTRVLFGLIEIQFGNYSIIATRRRLTLARIYIAAVIYTTQLLRYTREGIFNHGWFNGGNLFHRGRSTDSRNGMSIY